MIESVVKGDELDAQPAVRRMGMDVDIDKVVYCDLGTHSVYFAASSCAISGVLTA